MFGSVYLLNVKDISYLNEKKLCYRGTCIHSALLSCNAIWWMTVLPLSSNLSLQNRAIATSTVGPVSTGPLFGASPSALVA